MAFTGLFTVEALLKNFGFGPKVFWPIQNAQELLSIREIEIMKNYCRMFEYLPEYLHFQSSREAFANYVIINDIRELSIDLW